METSNNMNRLVFSLILLFTIISCKNNAQENKKSLLNNKQKILKGLPDDIANKTWIYIHSNPEYDKYNTYKNILDYNAGNSIKTEKNLFHTVLDVYETYYFEIPFDSVTLINNTYQINFKHSEIDYAKFKWLNKNKGVGEWEIRYLRYFDGVDSIVRNKSVVKSFVTKGNFPEPKKEKVVIKEDEIINSNVYSELIDDLPIEGNFSCEYKDGEEVHSGAYLKISNKDYEVENVSDNTTEIFRNDIEIKIEDVLYLQCDARKIKSSSNKYALFYKTFYTKYEPPMESRHYSKTHPIAEIEILDNNTIKKKWLGVYNKRTNKVESIDGYFDWGDQYCNIIKRVN
ncbi:hypothetical protein [Tenacibaculum maritimum]|uniref:hypothetical protein n=1 Tax=Tenacibaculum maritimum TaxID=107401 RepID=UPI0010A5223B|nr:hypothetical protein [Tenacibaculum maritimum]QCD62447.1 hypothetical protein B9C57_07780 [Tenacibaculum maritimum]